MAIGRLSTYGIHQVTVNNAIRLQNSIFNSQTQVSSGFKTQDFAGLDGQVEQYTTLENKIAKAGRYLTNNALIESRLNTMDTTLSQIIETANDAKNVILQRRNQTTADSIAFEEQNIAFFRTIAGLLNTSQEGRYLFAGASTDQKPVEDTLLPNLAVQGVPDDGYYNGSKLDLTARIQDDYQITYNVRADNEAFQNIMAGLSIAREGHRDQSDPKLVQAYDLIQKGIDQVIRLRASVGTNQKTVETANAKHASLNLYYKSLKEEVINTDIVGMTTQVAADQTVLQATYQIFSRINSLKLSDYLR